MKKITAPHSPVRSIDLSRIVIKPSTRKPGKFYSRNKGEKPPVKETRIGKKLRLEREKLKEEMMERSSQVKSGRFIVKATPNKNGEIVVQDNTKGFGKCHSYSPSLAKKLGLIS